jgi:hypothetical protein
MSDTNERLEDNRLNIIASILEYLKGKQKSREKIKFDGFKYEIIKKISILKNIEKSNSYITNRLDTVLFEYYILYIKGVNELFGAYIIYNTERKDSGVYHSKIYNLKFMDSEQKTFDILLYNINSKIIESQVSQVSQVSHTVSKQKRLFNPFTSFWNKSSTSSIGGQKSTYKLNGENIALLHNNKKIQRSIYTKEKGKTKYCKINNKFILLSKLKNKIIK